MSRFVPTIAMREPAHRTVLLRRLHPHRETGARVIAVAMVSVAGIAFVGKFQILS
ncbi:MAG: hypothetical protein ACI9JD_001355 [Rhodococcus sp. (in: high G+C Gram-positive bacteria)]|jgi:hypothetical protein